MGPTPGLSSFCKILFSHEASGHLHCLPRSGIMDALRAMDHELLTQMSASKVQRLFRGHLAKLEVERRRREWSTRKEAGLGIWAWYQGILTNRLEKERRAVLVKQRVASAILQNVGRGHLARRWVGLQSLRMVTNDAATKIGSVWRGFLARQQYAAMKSSLAEQVRVSSFSLPLSPSLSLYVVVGGIHYGAPPAPALANSATPGGTKCISGVSSYTWHLQYYCIDALCPC